MTNPETSEQRVLKYTPCLACEGKGGLISHYGTDGAAWTMGCEACMSTGYMMPAVVIADLEAQVEALKAALDGMRTKGETVEEWQTKCQTCHKDVTNNFCIYVEDRDGRTFDGGASVLASFLFCGPKCLKSYAEDYGRG